MKLKHNSVLFWLCIAFVAMTVATFQTWINISNSWLIMDGNYSHGYLLLAVVAWMIFENRDRINSCRPVVNYYAVALFLFSLLCWWLSLRLMIESLAAFFLVGCYLALVWAVFGFAVLKIVALPISLLFYSISMWDQVVYSLQLITVFAIQWPLELLGVEFTVTHTFIELEDIGIFEVAYGCSGLRYLLVSISLSSILGMLWFYRAGDKLIIIMCGALLGLISNWLRVAIIIYMGYITDMQSSLVDDHEAFGWILFSFFIFPFCYFMIKWSHSRVVRKNDSVERPVSQAVGIGSGIVLFLLMILVLSASLYNPSPDDFTGDVISIDLTDDWSSLPAGVSIDVGSSYLGPDRVLSNSFYKNTLDDIIRLDVNTYEYIHQQQGSELYAFVNRPYDSTTWQLKSRKAYKNYEIFYLKKHSERHPPMNYYLIRTYLVGGVFYGREKVSRFMQIPELLTGGNRTAMIELVLSCANCIFTKHLDPNKLFSQKSAL